MGTFQSTWPGLTLANFGGVSTAANVIQVPAFRRPRRVAADTATAPGNWLRHAQARGAAAQPVLVRLDTPVAHDVAANDASLHTPPATPAGRPLRIVRQVETLQARDAAGRMAISGRMADVCAALDRLAAASDRA